MAPPFKEAHFDILFGQGVSKAGEILDMAVDLKLVEKSGSWFSRGGERLGQGKENTVNYLRSRPEVLDELEKLIRASWVQAKLDKEEKAAA